MQKKTTYFEFAMTIVHKLKNTLTVNIFSNFSIPYKVSQSVSLSLSLVRPYRIDKKPNGIFPLLILANLSSQHMDMRVGGVEFHRVMIDSDDG